MTAPHNSSDLDSAAARLSIVERTPDTIHEGGSAGLNALLPLGQLHGMSKDGFPMGMNTWKHFASFFSVKKNCLRTSRKDGANAQEMNSFVTFGFAFYVNSLRLRCIPARSLRSEFVVESRSTPPGGSLIDQAVNFGATSKFCR
jgi:hypothetical protein